MHVAQDNPKGGREGRKAPSLEELQGLFEVVSKGKKVWETTFDAIVDPVLVVNKEFKIERANLSAAESGGMDVRKFVGMRCYEAFAKRKSPCVGCPMGLSKESKNPERKRLQPYSDGRAFGASAFPILGKDAGDPAVFVMQYQDMSALRKLEEQLLQNEKMAALGQFASGIAHDINNPLSGVLAFAQLARQGLKKGSQTYEDVKEIEDSALRCKKIVEDLLLFSRPIAKCDREWIDLEKVVKKVLPNIEIQYKDLNYELQVSLGNLPKVLVCESKLEQVFTNILNNAFQAIGPGGKIEISSGEDEEMIYVEIKDNGEGISQKNIESIFNPYFTTKRDRGGTGLGLPITFNIIREHGGRTEVHSEPGQGTSFRVYVPKGGAP